VERRRAGAKRRASFGHAEPVSRMAAVHAAVRWALLGLVIERRDQGYVLAQGLNEIRTPHSDSQALAQRLHAQALAIARSAALEWLQCARGEIQAL
jgi:hypothetical protein